MMKVKDIYENITQVFKNIAKFPSWNQSDCMGYCQRENNTLYSKVLCLLILNIRIDEQNIPSVYTILNYMPNKLKDYI